MRCLLTSLELDDQPFGIENAEGGVIELLEGLLRIVLGDDEGVVAGIWHLT